MLKTLNSVLDQAREHLKKQSKTVEIKIGRGVVEITLLDGETVLAPIQGRNVGGASEYSITMRVREMYDRFYLSTSKQFIELPDGRAVPVYNIKQMQLTQVDETYSITVER